MTTKPTTIRGACLALLLVLGTAGSVLAADDFRVDNRVYVANAKKPDSQGSTIFHAGVVYDFLDDPAEVIVFDKASGRFVLLDLQRHVRAELTTDEVTSFTNRIEQWAVAQKDPLIHFLANPKFDEEFDEKLNELTFKSPLMTYQVWPTVPDPAAAEQYRVFSDWYARLNTLLNPGSRPPSARLMVNEALARRHAIARDVRLTVTAKKGMSSKPTTVRSHHEVVPTLTPADLERVTQAQGYMQTFQLVAFQQYRAAKR